MISVCLIVKNEEKWIEACLKSIYPLATEIIIADTGCTDRTIEIARSFLKVSIFDYPWGNHFGNARNATIEKATQPWIFSFDADEKISAKSLEVFRSFIESQNSDPKVEAISLVRRDYVTNPSVSGFKPSIGDFKDCEGSAPGYYEERMVRIFRNLPHIRWEGALHEMVDKRVQGKIIDSDLIFHHYGYLPDEVDRKRKRDFYENEGLKKALNHPDDWKAHFDLAIEYVGSGKFKESIPLFVRAHQLTGPQAMIMSNLGYALMMIPDLDQAQRVLEQALKIFPTNHDSWLNLGAVLMRKGRYAEAAKKFEQVVKLHPQSFLAYRNLGLCRAHLEDFDGAASAIAESLKLFPTFADAQLDMALIRLHFKDFSKAEEFTQAALNADPQNARAQALMEHLKLAGKH